MSFLFFAVAALMLLSSVAVILLRNPLHSALCLIVSMIGMAVLFAMLEAHFLAVVQLIVYAGAIMVLVVFVLMLLQVKDEPVFPRSLGIGFLAVAGAATLLYFLIPVLSAGFANLQAISLSRSLQKGIEGTVEGMGQLLFSKYVYPFEIASLLIMAALVGAVMLGSRSIHKRQED